MTPPIPERVLKATSRALPLNPPLELVTTEERRRHRFLPSDVVSLADVWILLAIMWSSRVASGSGNLDPSVALFGLVSFGLLLSPRVSRLHREQLTISAIDDAGDIVRRVALAYAAASGFAVLTGTGDLRMLLTVAAVTAPAVLASRAASYAAERSLRQKRQKSRTLVVGAGDIARRLIQTIATHDEYGLEVIGVADDRPKYGASELGARLVGGFAEVPNVVRTQNVDTVIVAFSAGDQSGLIDVIRGAMAGGATVYVVPRFFELSPSKSSGDHLWGLPLVKLQPPARSRPEWMLKRTMDIVVAAVGLIAAAPVMVLAALAVLIESGRPILYRQSRVGIDGRPFDILKFRSMAVAPKRVENTEWSPDDLRVTRVGKFLRKSSLDELPQLFNVLKGDMSLVGPRPERPYFVGLFSDQYPQYKGRHRLPAGITGWAQIHGLKGDTSIEERAIFDNYYIENWSLSQDAKIIAKTALTFFREGRGGEDR